MMIYSLILRQKFVTIQNSLGEVIFLQKVNSESFEVDLSTQSKGLYFIAIETIEGVIVDKVMVF